MTPPDFRIRPATVDDAAGIAALFQEGTEPHHARISTVGCAGYASYIRRSLEAAPLGGDHHYWVADEGLAGSPLISALEARATGGAGWFVNNLHVSGRGRSNGVGRALLCHAVTAGAEAGYTRFDMDVFEDKARVYAWLRTLSTSPVSRTAFLDAGPPAAPAGTQAGIVVGWPFAVASLEAFGFGQVRVVGAATYDVGLLGSEWFRVSGTDLLGDAAAMEALRRLDPTRRLLILVPATDPPDADGLAVAVRLAAPIFDAIQALGPR